MFNTRQWQSTQTVRFSSKFYLPSYSDLVIFPLMTGELVACASGANFTPHIINVAVGEV
jgi:hypothetical protein